MDTIRAHVSAMKTLIEDPSLHPQHTIAYTTKMCYYALLLAKDSYLFELKNNPGLREKPEYTQYFIPCFEMQELDISECECAPNVNCTWMKSVKPLPKFKGFKLEVVKPNDTQNQDSYGFVHWDQVYDLKNSRKAERINNKYSIRNTAGEQYLHIHVFSKVKPEMVSLLGPFNDPKEVVWFLENQCGAYKKKCRFLDTPLDLPAQHKENILRKAIVLLKQLEDKNIFPDRKTDDNDGSKYLQNPKGN